jgi:hypothetical protein
LSCTRPWSRAHAVHSDEKIHSQSRGSDTASGVPAAAAVVVMDRSSPCSRLHLRQRGMQLTLRFDKKLSLALGGRKQK